MVRELGGEAVAFYGMLPSYRAMLDKEGVAGPGDVILAGDEASVPTQHRLRPDEETRPA